MQIFSVLFLLSMIMFRPTIWGQTMTTYGLISCLGLTLLFLVRFRNGVQQMERWVMLLAFAMIFFWMYCATAAILIGNSNLEFVMKAAIAGITSTTCYMVVFSNKKYNSLIFSSFAKMNALLGCSIVTTFILLFAFGYDFLAYSHIDVKGYDAVDSNGDILFPFSPVYGMLMEYDIYRFLAIYRESGIAQMFLVWSAVYLFLAKSSKLLIFGAIAGGILTASTSIVISLASVLLSYYYLEKKISIKSLIITCVLMVVLVSFLLYFPGLGLMDKRETHFDSIEDRSYAMAFAFDNLSTFIVGTGLYSMNTPFDNIGINAISSIYFIGVIGFMLYVGLFFVFGVFSKKKLFGRYAMLILPLFLTSILFQPLIDAPLAYMLLFCIPPEKS